VSGRDELTEVERLELLRLEADAVARAKAAAQKRLADTMNELLRSEYRKFKGEPRPDAEPTAYAREKIAEMERLYPVMRRTEKGGRVSRMKMAVYVGIDRETITDWKRRGWMNWPPVKTPQE